MTITLARNLHGGVYVGGQFHGRMFCYACPQFPTFVIISRQTQNLFIIFVFWLVCSVAWEIKLTDIPQATGVCVLSNPQCFRELFTELCQHSQNTIFMQEMPQNWSSSAVASVREE